MKLQHKCTSTCVSSGRRTRVHSRAQTPTPNSCGTTSPSIKASGLREWPSGAHWPHEASPRPPPSCVDARAPVRSHHHTMTSSCRVVMTPSRPSPAHRSISHDVTPRRHARTDTTHAAYAHVLADMSAHAPAQRAPDEPPATRHGSQWRTWRAMRSPTAIPDRRGGQRHARQMDGKYR